MVASSIISSFEFLTSFARLLWAEICSVESAAGFRGAFILLWNVHPRSRRFAAIPVVAMASAVDPPSMLLTALRIVLRRYVFPHPPLASMNM